MLMTDKPEAQMYSILDVARILGVSDETIRRMIRDGQIEAVKVRNQWRIRKDVVDKYLGKK